MPGRRWPDSATMLADDRFRRAMGYRHQIVRGASRGQREAGQGAGAVQAGSVNVGGRRSKLAVTDSTWFGLPIRPPMTRRSSANCSAARRRRAGG